MKFILAVTALSLVSMIAHAQSDEQVLCKSLIDPANVKVFEGKHCPFGWVTVNNEGDN